MNEVRLLSGKCGQSGLFLVMHELTHFFLTYMTTWHDWINWPWLHDAVGKPLPLHPNVTFCWLKQAFSYWGKGYCLNTCLRCICILVRSLFGFSGFTSAQVHPVWSYVIQHLFPVKYLTATFQKWFRPATDCGAQHKSHGEPMGDVRYARGPHRRLNFCLGCEPVIEDLKKMCSKPHWDKTQSPWRNMTEAALSLSAEGSNYFSQQVFVIVYAFTNDRSRQAASHSKTALHCNVATVVWVNSLWNVTPLGVLFLSRFIVHFMEHTWKQSSWEKCKNK